MFNLLISIIATMCGCIHHGHERNEMALNAPVTLLRCNVSISPQKRSILYRKALPERERFFIQRLFETARRERYAFVCCEFFLQTEDGRTVGILMDNDQRLAEGFDLGKKMNAKETYTKSFHNMKIIQDRADQERLYTLIHELFKSTNSTLRTSDCPVLRSVKTSGD